MTNHVKNEMDWYCENEEEQSTDARSEKKKNKPIKASD